MSPPFRLPNPGSPGDYQTFGARVPRRQATCAEVDCGAYLNGWSTTVMRGSDDEALLRQACAGAVDGQRRHAVELPEEGGFVRFVFEAGQPCFAAARHTVAATDEGLYLRRDGDWRANLGGTHFYDRPDQWTDDLRTRHERIRHLKETRG